MGAEALQWISDMCSSISEALPVLLDLTLFVPEVLRATLDATLNCPAPHLRRFSLFVDNGGRCAPPVPTTIFAGRAPKLDIVELVNIMPGDIAIPVFAAVRNVTLKCRSYGPPIPISSMFPAVRHLKLVCTGLYSQQEITLRFNLHGLVLDKLTLVDDMKHIVLGLSEPLELVYQTPVVVHENCFPDWCPAFWPTIKGYLSMRIVERRAESMDAVVTVVSTGRDYVRVFKIRSSIADSVFSDDDGDGHGPHGSPLSGLEFLSARFTYIRLESKFLEAFFAFGGGFAALRRLHIDVYSRIYHTSLAVQRASAVGAPCPILADLVIFAMDKQRLIHRAEVATLAALMGLDDGHAAHAVLILAGVDFVAGDTSSFSESVFTTIVHRPFSGKGSPDDEESGLWEY